MKSKVRICELCQRENIKTTVHHLIPKEEGGTKGPTAHLCTPCHSNVHALYSNKELATRLHTIENLQEDERIQKYLGWIKKQPASATVRTRRSKAKK